ncbi:acyl-CoA dehydrogenase family protein [Streptomyces marincola]|uniref:Acyl-CoA dehydrogenase n=1 Tax=Streptomyces marincola TaxID=2878388 RepID=A0A1W7CWW7_9ACTN|nr:acyl-CoA dehydrogenase [Streptomyces marincola]ARQ68830.1 hypothetical protein CAG99_08100 [Streptomyces marincola]
MSVVDTLTCVLAEHAVAGGPLSPATALALDRDEAFPTAGRDLLDAAGLHRLYVPPEHGGGLDSYPALVTALARVASHDVTLAIAHAKTFLGAAPVWVAGDRNKADRLARRVLAGAVVSWGLTERGHGADLLAGEVTATETHAGWSLSGSKWLINNAGRCDLVCVLARTAPRGGPRGYSLLLVDLAELPSGSYRRLPKVPTHGVRGADISGLAFHDAPLPADALVGEAGTGLEITLRALQLTRTLCPALSVGAVTHVLRLAREHLDGLERYGHRASELPATRRILGQAVATLWVMEAVTLVAACHPHLAPGRLSVVSAVAKALVPTLADQVVEEVRELMGARGFLADGMFQKVERDNRIVAIFDGSTPVNEDALLRQLPHVARRWRDDAPARAAGGDAGATGARLGRLTGELPAIDFRALRLTDSGEDDLVAAVPALVSRARRRGVRAAGLDAFAALVRDTLTAVAALEPVGSVPAEHFDLARRYELCFAGAACLVVRLGDAPVDDHWLEICLTRVLELAAGAPHSFPRAEVFDDVAHLSGRLLLSDPEVPT